MTDDLENVDLTLQVLKQLAGELLAGDGFDCYGNSRLLQAESAVTHGVRTMFNYAYRSVSLVHSSKATTPNLRSHHIVAYSLLM